MFTDEPSPFRPRPDRNTGVLVIGCLLAGALGMYLFLDWTQARDAAARRLAMRAASPQPVAAPRPAPGPEPRNVAAPAPIASAGAVPALAAAATPVTIYLCRSYAGGSFWSNANCHTQRATVDRMTTVPGDLPFDRQVEIASGQAQEAALLYASAPPGGAAPIGPSPPGAARGTECTAIEEAVRQNDAMARQPQSASVQDWLRGERMRLQSRRAALSC